MRITTRIARESPSHSQLSLFVNGALAGQPGSVCLRNEEVRDFCDRIQNGIVVYKFHDAPEYLRVLSLHGGDEDWVLVLPPGEAAAYSVIVPFDDNRRIDIPWLAETVFGCADVQECWLPDGTAVLIGAHA